MATKKKPAPKKKSAPKTSRPAAKTGKRPVASPKRTKPVQKAPVKKAAPKKAPAKKAPAKKSPPKPSLPRKAGPAASRTAAPKPAPRAAAPAPSVVPPAKPARAFRKEELAAFRAILQQQLELVQGNLNALAGDNLKLSPMESTGDISSHSTHMADHGTDNFDRELALSLASSRQDSLYDIEDAIRRIDDGEYGSCEACGSPIERPRLKALPFAKKCVACQNAAERGRGRHQPFRGGSHVQAVVNDEAPDASDS